MYTHTHTHLHTHTHRIHIRASPSWVLCLCTAVSSRLQCNQQNNASVEAWCRGRFSQGLQYVFAVQLQQAFDNDVNIYRQLACQ